MFTPRLVGIPGQEPHLEPFWTKVAEENGTSHEAALITSPEYAMKRLLAAGFDKIYDLGPCFRNGEPWDGTHDPEFLLLEWYRRDAGLEELMQDTEAMIRSAASATPSAALTLPKEKFRRLTVAEAMKKYANVDLNSLLERPEMVGEVARAHGQTVGAEDSFDDLFFKIFLSEVEPRLGWNEAKTEVCPTFLYYYPASMAALARRSSEDPRYALRTELYIGDLELANGFAELADAAEQRARFQEEKALRQKLGKKTWGFDEHFLRVLPEMGQAAGIAFGVDRLAMLFAGTGSINDIIPFPAKERFS